MTTEISAEEMVVQIAPQATITSIGGEASGATTRVVGPGNVGAMELGRRLLLAARAGDTQLVLDLMAKGAPFTTDWLGTSPLHLAAGNAHAATCGVLLRAGVSRDSRTKVERTPLHLAAHGGHASVASLLLRHGAAVDCRDLLRMTPLHWAAQRGHTDVATVLLNYGADPTAVSKFNKTPMDLATRAGHTDILKLLEDASRQREAARSVRALVAERMAEQGTVEPEPQQQQTFATIQKIVPEIRTTAELPEQLQIKLTKLKQVQEKPTKPEEKKEPPKPVKDSEPEASQDKSGATGGAAAILRRHGITLLPPDTGGTVLSALQSGRTVVLSDAGKLMLQESSTRTPAAPTAAKVKLIQLPADTRPTVRRTNATIGTRPPVKIIMNKSNFERLVTSQNKATILPTSTLTTVTNTNDGSSQEVAKLKAQLAASQKTVAKLTEELKVCRAMLAHYEGQ